MLQKETSANAQQFTLQNLKEIVNRWLLLENDQIVDVIMGTYLANQLNSDPLWLLLIAPPSNAKTELLRALGSHDKAFFISTLTPSTLISGLNKEPNPSLIFQLDGKILVIKDFTTILSMRSENQQEILSQLREMYDGQFSKGVGSGKCIISWEGKVGLLAACTPIYDRHHATISALGDRFLLYRSKLPDPEETGRRALEMCGREDEMREELKEAFKAFLDQFNLETITIQRDEAIDQKIVTLACFCAAARCAVERDYDKTVSYVPQPEGSPRLVKQLIMLGTGIAIAQGKAGIDKDIYNILKDVAISLIPANRRKVIEYLFQEEAFCHLSGWRKTAEIADAIGLPRPTMIYVGEDLTMAGVVNKRLLNDERDNDKWSPYLWQLTELTHNYITSTGLFNVGRIPF